jgi:RNA polymerase sigma-70 factor, ECF subfamily
MTETDELNRVLAELRPKLHRYCARMTGSVIDGEDVVQEAMIKALEAAGRVGTLANPEGWLFRIAHNAALDFLRRRARREAGLAAEGLEMIEDPANPTRDREIAAMSLRTFMRLPAAQRSTVILMDVLGYSLHEIGEVTDTTLPAVKAALHRGRTRLRELAAEPEDLPPPVLAAAERARLAAYIDRFNARDFDAVRDMLADEVKLDLVNRTRRAGRRDVSEYFTNYSKVHDWLLVPGFVDRRPAILVCDPTNPEARPAYFVLLDWSDDRLLNIRDFRYAKYATDDAEVIRLDER